MVEVIHSMSLVGQQYLNEGRRPGQREADAGFVVLPFSEDSSSTLCAPKPKKAQLCRQSTLISGAAAHVLFSFLVKVYWVLFSCSQLFFNAVARFLNII